ncbi:MAG: hypothetical protein ACTHKF_01995 [Candidatus Nitrosocosmicus sp.]
MDSDSNLQQILSLISPSILYIHKLQIQTTVDQKYYNDLKLKPEPVNNAKIYEVSIDQAHSKPNLKFVISSYGTVMVYIINSCHPFRLYTEQDVSDILVFLGSARDSIFSFFRY